MELIECIHFLMATAQNKISTNYQARLTPYDITPSQVGVLSAMEWKDNVSPKQIAEALHLESSTVSGILDRMQKKGLINRVVNAENRREVQVVLTPKARALREDMSRVAWELDAAVLGEYTPEEEAAFKKILQDIVKRTF